MRGFRTPDRFLIPAFIVISAGGVCPELGSASGVPAMPMVKMPSDGHVTVTSQWVAPYVQYVEVRGRDWRQTVVRWFSEGGELMAQADSLEVIAHGRGSCFRSQEDAAWAFHGVYNDWHFVASSDEHYGVTSMNGKVFVQFLREEQYGPAIGMELYVQGEPKGRLGPFDGMTLAYQSVGDDGSVAGLFSPNDPNTPSRALATNTNGEITMDLTVEGVSSVTAAPGGAGLLVFLEDGGLMYATVNEAPSPIVLDQPLHQVSRHVAWVPGSPKVVLTTRPALVFVDCERGRVDWRVGNTLEWGGADGHYVAFAGYVFTCGTEVVTEQPKTGSRVIKAFDQGSGELVALWKSTPSMEFASPWESGKFMIRGDRLYYVTPDEFAEIDPESVASAGEGCCPWQLPDK